MTQTTLTELEWQRLLQRIEAGRVIPVIGEELLSYTSQNKRLDFYNCLAYMLAKKLHLALPIKPMQYTLHEVACNYLKMNHDGDLQDIHDQIRILLSEKKWSIPNTLLKLAAISHFKFFLSTTFDSMLKNAIDKIRFNMAPKTVQLTYSTDSKVVDLPKNYDTYANPVVYRIFGGADTKSNFVVTEENLLEFNHRLQSRDYQPSTLFNFIKSSHLLVLGCNFPDWLTRFFLRAAKGERIYIQGIQGLMVGEHYKNKNGLLEFCNRHNLMSYPGFNPHVFVDELYDRWKKRNEKRKKPVNATLMTNKKSPNNKFEEAGLFISYASEDRPYVELIKQQLDREGIDAWYDEEQLAAGDDFSNKIEDNIQRCSYFIPIISQHTRLEDRYFWFEWNIAIKRSYRFSSQYPFIQPIVIDHTSYNSSWVPNEFKKCTWLTLKNGQLPPAFFQITRKRIRNLRREQEVYA